MEESTSPQKGSKFSQNLSSPSSFSAMSDPQIDCSQLISALIKNTDFFKETFPTSDELTTFASLSKSLFHYTVHKYGTILADSQELESKLYIILKGQATLLQKRILKPSDFSFKNQKYRIPLIKKSTLTSSPQLVPQSGSLELPENELSGSLGWLPAHIDDANKTSTARHRRNIVKIGTMPPLHFIQENDYQISPTSKCTDDRSPTKSLKNFSMSTLTCLKPKRVTIVHNSKASISRREGLRINFSSVDDDESPSGPRITNDTSSIIIKDDSPNAKYAPAGENLSRENIAFIDDFLALNPDRFDQSPSFQKTTLSPTAIYEVGDCFGDPLAKKDKDSEGELTGVSSEEIHVISISSKDYLNVYNIIMDQRAAKLGLFTQIFTQGGHEELIKRFSRYFQLKSFQKGEVIYKQNDTSNELYLIFKGEIKVSKEASVSFSNNKAGTHSIFAEINKRIKLPITYLSETQFFGEESVINEPLRQYTAVANSTNVEVFCLVNAGKASRDRRFEDLFDQIREQAQEKFHWRRERVSTLIERKQKGLKLQQITTQNINLAALNVPNIGGSQVNFQRAQHVPVKSLSSISNLHESIGNGGSITDIPLDKSILMKGNIFTNNVNFSGGSSSQEVNFDTYKKKYSRRVKVLYPDITRSAIRTRKYDSETARKAALEPISLRDIRGFNIRKELEDTTTNRSKLSKSNESRSNSNSPIVKKILTLSPQLKPVMSESSNMMLKSINFVDKSDRDNVVVKLPESRRNETRTDFSPIMNPFSPNNSPKKTTCYELKFFEETPDLSSAKIYEKVRLQKMLDTTDSLTRSYRLRNGLKGKEHSKSCVNIHTQAVYKAGNNNLKLLSKPAVY